MLTCFQWFSYFRNPWDKLTTLFLLIKKLCIKYNMNILNINLKNNSQYKIAQIKFNTQKTVQKSEPKKSSRFGSATAPKLSPSLSRASSLSRYLFRQMNLENEGSYRHIIDDNSPLLCIGHESFARSLGPSSQLLPAFPHGKMENRPEMNAAPCNKDGP